MVRRRQRSQLLPINEPSTITAGDYLEWVRPYNTLFFTDKDGETQYLKASTCTLTYHLINKDAHIEIVASATSEDYLATQASTTTEKWAPGLYYWSAIVSHSTGGVTRQWTLDKGQINILPNFNKSGVIEYDGRSHVKKVLDALEVAIEGRANKATLDWISYSIAGRSRAIDPRELRIWLAQYRWLYRKELGQTGEVFAELP